MPAYLGLIDAPKVDLIANQITKQWFCVRNRNQFLVFNVLS